MRKPAFAAAAAILVAGLAASPSAFSQSAPFGNPEDLDFAARLWTTMDDLGVAGVTGDNVIRGLPYVGTEPHGFVLDTLFLKATMDGRTADLVVKRNYGPEGVSVPEVQADAAGHLAAVTVMFKREAGYNEENGNWFWAKFLPDGRLDQNPAGLQLAGRIAKGMDEGCIACHRIAPGEDYLFGTDHIR